MLPLLLLLLLAGLRAASTAAPHPRPHVTAAAPLPRAFAAPPPSPDPALECALKELLLNASMARVPWFRDVARIHDALRCCSARPERLPPLPAPPPPAAYAASLFVSAVNGSDAHDGGSPLAPLRSLHAAQAAARALRLRLGAAPRLTVHLAGTFYLPATLRLDAAEDARTTWRSWPGAEPAVVSGGLPLSGLAWGPSPRFPAPVLAAALPAAAPASGLLFALHDASSAGAPGGRRLPAAREPNGDAETQMQPTGWALCRGPAGGPLPFPAGAPPAPAHVEVDAPRRNVTAFPVWGRDHDPRNPPQGYVWYGEGGGAAAWMAGARTFWANKTLPGGLYWNATGGLDPRSGGRSSPFNASGWPAVVAPAGRRRAHVFHDSLWGNWVFDIASVDAGAGSIAFARGGWQEGRGGGIRAQPFFVEGEAAALDAPGEWWVDPASATLHLWPNASDGAPPALLVLPVLETLVAVGAGAPGVALAGLAFQHTVDGLMQPYSVPEAGDWSLRAAAAVEVDGAVGTSLTGCAWQRTGGNGLLVTGAARDTLVEDCEFYLQGSSAIAVVGSAPYANSTAAAPPGAAPAAYPTGVTILRALVEGVGVLGKQSSALFVSVACGVVLQDSVLYSGPRSGVNWNDGFCGGSRIEGSVLFDWVRETQDHGAVNTWHRSMYVDPRNASAPAYPEWYRITGNAIFNGPSNNRDLGNLWPSVDNDDGSSQMFVSRNVLIFGGNKNYLGADKVWDSNLVVFPGRWSGDSCLTCWSGGGHVFTNNTCYTPESDSPTYFDSSPAGASCVANYSDPAQQPLLPYFARNTYGTATGGFSAGCQGELTLAGMQALGQEVGSVVVKGYTAEGVLAHARALLGL